MLRLRALLPLVLAALCVGVVHHRGPHEPAGTSGTGPCPPQARLVGRVDPWGYRHELCEERTPDGRRVAEGPWTAWHPTGAPSAHGEMRGGRQVGTWTFWNEAGQPIESIEFRDGVPIARRRLGPQ
jgi:hypothetical protein